MSGGAEAPLTAEALMAAGATETPGTVGAAGGLAPAGSGLFSSLARSFGQRPDLWLRAGSPLLPKPIQPLASVAAGGLEMGSVEARNQDYLEALSIPEAQRTSEQKLLLSRGAPRQTSDIAGAMATDVAKGREQAQRDRENRTRNVSLAPPVAAAAAPFRPPISLTPLATVPQSTMKADPMTVLLQRLLMAQQPPFLG